METIKLKITIDKDWLEATWIKEVTTINEVEKEVDGELIKETVQEESVTTEQLHCESFSGHPEHIAMLVNKATEFGTPLDEYQDLIEQLASTYVAPTQAELDEAERVQKLSEFIAYLNATDYKMTVDYFATLTQEVQDELVLKRAEAREYIRANSGGK